MESVFTIIIIMIMAFVAISKRSKASSKQIEDARARAEQNAKALASGKNTKSLSSAPNVNRPARKAPVSTFDAEIGSSSGGMNKSSREGLAIRDDRYNDWLARQMRYEKMSLGRLNEMFSFEVHKNNGCDAELLREFHHASCSADGIDTAKGR